MAQDAITIAVSVTLKIDVPTHKPGVLGHLPLTPDDIITLATHTADGIVTEAIANKYPERRPGWYEWASHSCGEPVSRCVSVEGATALVNTESLEMILAGADPDWIDPGC